MSGTPGVLESIATIADRLVALFVPHQKASACEQYEDFCGCVGFPANPLAQQRSVRICCGSSCGSCYETGELC